MNKLWLYSILLLLGLFGSQFSHQLPEDVYRVVDPVLTLLTMTGLAYIMINVGREFQIDKSKTREYGWDYIVAATAATFPWIFCAIYFVVVFSPSVDWGSWPAWRDSLLVARFAAPTSAGVLFSMLAAAGLASTWVFKKARILAIFDDLDTVLLMIPLKIAVVGFSWMLMGVIGIIIAQLWIAWVYLNRLKIPHSSGAILFYGFIIAAVSEVIYLLTDMWGKVPINIEVLLPAFVLGCLIKEDVEPGHDEGHQETRLDFTISALFMVLVGLSMPLIAWNEIAGEGSMIMVLFHVLVVTVIANLGKMFPAFCYRKEASWRQRLAVSIGMWPRGEVGAGVLILSLSYGISGAAVGVASLCLALNLAMTGVFIGIIRRLLAADGQLVEN
ncbi:MAG: sodium:proton antiporter [Desulfuromonas sp.]|nr:MAG: sodium:proton antiporter [Desulfuromonas sp.]